MTTRRRWPSLLLSTVLALLLLPASSGPQSVRSGTGTLPGQTLTVLPDGRSLILGGQGSHGPTRTAVIYDPRTGTNTALAPLEPARAWHSATVLPDGAVLIFGGTSSSDLVLADPQVLDPRLGNVQSLAIPEMAPRTHHSATLLTARRTA
jgi:hypothetical protein